MERIDRIPAALLALRVGIFILLFAWTIDKLVRPQHAAHEFEQFYGLKARARRVPGSVLAARPRYGVRARPSRSSGGVGIGRRSIRIGIARRFGFTGDQAVERLLIL